MRLALLLLAPAAALAFVPAIQKTSTSATKLDMERRDVLITGIMGLVAAPAMAQAAASTNFYEDKTEASQMATGGKVDLNSAFVVSCDVASLFVICVLPQPNLQYSVNANLMSIFLLHANKYIQRPSGRLYGLSWHVPPRRGKDCEQRSLQLRQGHLQN